MAEKKKGRGRPPALSEVDFDWVRRMAASGMTTEQIGIAMGTTGNTIKATAKRQPEFLAALEEGRNEAKGLARRSLFALAVGYAHTETLVHYDTKRGEFVTKEVVKRYPPNLGALALWLTNTDRQNWRHARYIDYSKGDGSPPAPQYLEIGGARVVFA